MNEHEFHVACAILEDHRKLIAAGKSQRWDVIKWAVTINVALTTASIALQGHENAAKRLFWLALCPRLAAGHERRTRDGGMKIVFRRYIGIGARSRPRVLTFSRNGPARKRRYLRPFE